MLNIHELESQWLRYKIKSFIPHSVIAISLLIIITLLFTIDFSHENKKIEVKNNIIASTNSTKIEKQEVKQIPIVEKTLPIAQIEEKQKQEENLTKTPVNTKSFVITQESKPQEKLIIKPSLDFMRTMQENLPDYYKQETLATPQVKQPPIQKVFTPIIEEVVLDTKIEDIDAKEAIVSKEIKIKRQNTQDDIQHVIQRFKQSNNPALSLFIAKKYYDAQDYNQAYNYALVTNEINNDIEESWIVFAKSLYKLDQKDKAIEMLNKYIVSSNSQKAKILLDNIKAGKI